MADIGTLARPAHDDVPPRPGRGRRRLVVVIAVVVVVVTALAAALVLTLRGRDEKLAWAPPELDDPTTVEVSEDERSLELEPDQDYVIQMPDQPLDVVGGLVISGGHDVVLIGGEIRISKKGERPLDNRGLYLKNQTGTVHVEGLHITGPELAEGINLDQREGATVQLENIRVETVRGDREGHHADVVQTWAGPGVLRVDRLTASSTYQGFFLLPEQFMDESPDGFDLRHVNLVGKGEDAGYMLWRDDEKYPIDVEDVWIAPAKGADHADDVESVTWPEGEDTWDDVQLGLPPGGDFVPADRVGIGYESPGYREPAGD